MDMQVKSMDELPIDGGWMSLDFVNTISNRNVEPPYDYISSYGRFLEWADKMHLLAPDKLQLLTDSSHQNAIESAKSWIRIIEIREMLFRMFQSIAEGKNTDIKDQRLFNNWLSKAMKHTRIEFNTGESIRSLFQFDPTDLDHPLYPIIKSAYDLLLSDKIHRVKECGACGWLFLDKSKNNSRRWCNMDTCGSQSKARNYYYRKKESKS